MNRKVNLFVIGQPKSGTTALYNYLKQHPQLFLPEQKQLYHFATDHNRERKAKKKYNRKYYRKYYNYDFNDYISRFDFSTNKSYYCDITPDYFYSQTAAEEIYKYNTNAKILLFLREPLQFLKSFHTQMINSGCEDIMDFWEAYQADPKQPRNLKDSLCPEEFLNYKKLIDYIGYLKPWVKYFSDNIKIVLYEDFKNNNFETLKTIFEFLNVEPFLPSQKIISNVSKTPSKSNIKKITNVYIFRYISMFISPTIKNKLKELLYLSNDKKKVDYSNLLNDSVEKDTKFKKSHIDKIVELDSYCKNHNLYLIPPQKTLIKFWNYV